MQKSLPINGGNYNTSSFVQDLTAGLVVFLVALPLCLGVALASGVPLFSGILAGIIGGIIVGVLSGSQTSVSGPAAGLTAVVAVQISILGSFEAFFLAVALAGILQIGMGLAKWGKIGVLFPSSVIKGLLAAIGIILILKQIPHLIGHDSDPMGEKSFLQPNNKNTITTLIESFFDIHAGALLIGLSSMAILMVWDRVNWLKKLPIPSPLIVVVFGIILNIALQQVGGIWAIQPTHLVQVPVMQKVGDFFNFLILPDFNHLMNPKVYVAAATVAIIASLETLLNLEAIDKLDPLQRNSPPNRELLAQGAGNIIAGLIGALPVTSVIVRSSVNINAGVKTKVSTIWHGLLLIGSVLFLPTWLNTIPLSALAAILLVTGLKLASPKLVRQMWQEGKNQFLPFICTVLAIVFTDLLIGVVIGLCVAIGFIIHSNIRNPMRKILEKHATGDQVLHIELPSQASFFNKANLDETLRGVPKGGHVLIDASSTDYIDPDIYDLIIDFQNTIAPAHKVHVSLKGFKDKYPELEDQIEYIDFSSRELQNSMTPQKVLEVFKEGNERFRKGKPLDRDLSRLVNATSEGQFPMAVILSCIDSRTPAEIIFDLGLGDVFSIRLAGNVISRKVLGSMEYACAIAGAKLIMVMGHTSCGAVKASVEFACNNKNVAEVTGCTHLNTLVEEIKHSINSSICKNIQSAHADQLDIYANEVAYRNVIRSIKLIREKSPILDRLVKEGKIAIIGAMYDISTGEVSFFKSQVSGTAPVELATLEV